MAEQPGKIRIDKWLWQARFFKTRSLAAQVCRAGKVRVNGNRISKASVLLVIGDVLTFPKVHEIKVIELLALGERRGPAVEAQSLYKDQSPPVLNAAETHKDKMVKGLPAHREAGSGRPTKAERRATDKLLGRD